MSGSRKISKKVVIGKLLYIIENSPSRESAIKIIASSVNPLTGEKFGKKYAQDLVNLYLNDNSSYH
jgi:hypothetical protein